MYVSAPPLGGADGCLVRVLDISNNARSCCLARCLYIYLVGKVVMWVLVWVDDALIADNDSATRTAFVKALSKRFPTEDKGDCQWLLNP